MAGGLTEMDRKNLSPEEIEALEADEGGEGGEDAPDADAADAGAGDDKGADKDAPADEGDDKAAPAPAAKADKKEGDDATDPAAAAPAPDRPSAELPRLRPAEAKDWDALEAAIVTKYEGGELTEAEYRKQLREVHIEQTRAEVRAELNAEFQQANWDRDTAKFRGEHPEYATNLGRWAALNAHMERIENETEGKLTGAELLAKAHEAVLAEDAGLGAKPGSSKPDTKRPQPSEGDVKKRAGDKVPATLGDLPAADDVETGNDRWAVLDRLAETDGMAFERELAKLPQAEQDAYLRAA